MVVRTQKSGDLLGHDACRAQRRDHTIQSVSVMGGCNGNLKGICKLLAGMKAEDAIARMKGTTCGSRPTSCPDQISRALEEALAAMG